MTTAAAVATMKAAQVTGAGAGLRIVELEIPDPGPGQGRIKVQACGVCHSDAMIIEGRRPGISETFVQWCRVPACGIIASTH
jgi:D-arabinose 1-dehydrogenase-like Zn-dependent alcohol dehydrogenase